MLLQIAQRMQRSDASDTFAQKLHKSATGRQIAETVALQLENGFKLKAISVGSLAL